MAACSRLCGMRRRCRQRFRALPMNLRSMASISSALQARRRMWTFLELKVLSSMRACAPFLPMISQACPLVIGLHFVRRFRTTKQVFAPIWKRLHQWQ